MQTDVTIFSTLARRPEGLTRAIMFRPGILNKCRHFIESTDWDEDFIHQEKWINRICLVFVFLSALYFVPILLSPLMK